MLFERNVYQPYVHKGGDRVGSPLMSPRSPTPDSPCNLEKLAAHLNFIPLKAHKYAGSQKLYTYK